MGLFDRFKRRVQEVAEDVDSDELTATEDSEEGQVALQTATEIEEDWDDEPLVEPTETPVEPIESDDEWDDWDDDEYDIDGQSERAASGQSTIFGRGGDFVTAPELSSVFGHSLCVWFMTVWQQEPLGKPKDIQFEKRQKT